MPIIRLMISLLLLSHLHVSFSITVLTLCIIAVEED